MGALLTLLRHARREWRAAELKPVLGALLIAVVAATGVLAFAERVERALGARSSELIGGDAVLNSRLPIPQTVLDKSAELGLQASLVVTFPTVLFAEEASVLVEVKAVEPNYPLRGRLRVAAEASTEGLPRTPPGAGGLYLDARAASALGAGTDSGIEIGNSRLRLEGILVEDPEGAGSFLTLAPRALVARADIERLGLLGPASRAFHRLLLAGPEPALAALVTWMRAEHPDLRPVLAAQAEQQLAEVGRQARAFFGLAALAVLWLAALAIALTARRYTEARREVVAQLRCFGLSRQRILLQLGGTLTVYALPAVLLGLLLGYGLQELIARGVTSLFQESLPPPGLRPALLGALVGLLAYLSFTLPALVRLAATPPSRLLREGLDRPGWIEWAAYPAALAVLTLAIWLLTGEGRLGLIAFAGISLLALALALAIGALLWLLRRHLPGQRFALRQALRQLAARPGATLLSSVSLALALAAVLLLGAVRTDLVGQWRMGLGQDTPNRFLLNIQPEQRGPLLERLSAIGIESPQLYPFAVGRLLEINGERPDPAHYADPRAARWVNGNINLSWSADLPEANRITSGGWWSGGPEVSVAENWARIFQLQVGDELTIGVADRRIRARIGSIRAVDWDSFRVNFFLLFEPATVAGLESTWITSLRVEAPSSRDFHALLREFPNISLIDVEALLTRILGVVDAVVRSLSAIFWCALAAAVCVLLAALTVSVGARRFESALWRSLGAPRAVLARTQQFELGTIGALGGGFGGTAALLIAEVLAAQVFRIDYAEPWWIIPAGAAIGALLALTAGWLVLRDVVTTPPGRILQG